MSYRNALSKSIGVTLATFLLIGCGAPVSTPDQVLPAATSIPPAELPTAVPSAERTATGAGGIWTARADMPTGRWELSTCVVDGKIYAIGGYVPGVSGHPGVATVEVYDPATDTWATAPDMPNARFAPRTSVVDGKIYVIGGMDKWVGSAYKTVLEYDP